MTAWAPASPALPPLTLLSVVIPARDEEESVPTTLEHLGAEPQGAQIPHEIVVVDDGSSDGTWAALQSMVLGAGRECVFGSRFDRVANAAIAFLGHSWTVVPVSRRNRRHGVPKLKLRNVACRYAARALSVWVETLRTRRAPGCA